MKTFIFPGQGAQHPGMGKELYEHFDSAKVLFEEANDILGFNITGLMFDGTQEDLRQTKVTQPAIFLHSVILASTIEDFNPEMVAGHSLGEFSAAVAAGALAAEDGLRIVRKRGELMFASGREVPGTMAGEASLGEAFFDDLTDSSSGEIFFEVVSLEGKSVLGRGLKLNSGGSLGMLFSA